jgi:hypothetical protein
LKWGMPFVFLRVRSPNGAVIGDLGAALLLSLIGGLFVRLVLWLIGDLVVALLLSLVV